MRKKVGEVIVESYTKNFKISIWGSIYKANDGKLLGGVHFNITPSMFEDFYPFVQQLLETCEGYRLKDINDEYGERFRISFFGALKDFDANEVIERLKDVPEYEDEENKIYLKILQDYDFVLESKMIKDL